MRARIPASTLKRLEALEEQKEQRRSVALFPVIQTLENWGNLAVSMQAVLKDNVKRDCAPDYGNLPKIELLKAP